MPIKITHIPPLLTVERLLGGRLPPAIFIVAPKGPQECDSCGHPEVKMEVEEFIHLGILPKELQATVRQEIRMVMYRLMDKDLRAIRAGEMIYDLHYRSTPGQSCEDRILERMAQVWPSLSKQQQDLLDAEGSTCFPPEFH